MTNSLLTNNDNTNNIDDFIETGGNATDVLMSVPIPIVPDLVCEAVTILTSGERPAVFPEDPKFCAGGENNRDTCMVRFIFYSRLCCNDYKAITKYQMIRCFGQKLLTNSILKNTFRMDFKMIVFYSIVCFSFSVNLRKKHTMQNF